MRSMHILLRHLVITLIKMLKYNLRLAFLKLVLLKNPVRILNHIKRGSSMLIVYLIIKIQMNLKHIKWIISVLIFCYSHVLLSKYTHIFLIYLIRGKFVCLYCF